MKCTSLAPVSSVSAFRETKILVFPSFLVKTLETLIIHKTENLRNLAAFFLLLDIVPLVILEPDAPLWPAEQSLHFVQAHLPLQNLAHDHVTRRVHIVAIPGGDAVPGGEAQLPRQLVHLVIRDAPLVTEVTLIGEKNCGDLCKKAAF